MDVTTTVGKMAFPSLYIGSILAVSEDRVQMLPPRIRESIPSPEPKPPSDLGWLYRVLEPYYTKECIDNVNKAMAEGQISSGSCWPRLLAKEICTLYNVPVALPTSSGASALTVALLACRLGPQDQVLVPAFTMVAVANAVKMVGAKPVYCDSAAGSLNPGCKELLQRSTPLTRAVIICHTYGVAGKETQAIADLCKERGWWLIEDICEAMGCRADDGSLVGTFGDFAVTSLYANKQITSGDGGWVHARDAKHHDRLKSLINHGFDPAYHFLHFETAPNAKMNGLGAAFVCAQVKSLPEVIKHRESLARWYRASLQTLEEISCMEKAEHDAPWVFGVEVKDRQTRDQLRDYLAENGIETRNYFFPLHLEPVNYYSGDAGVYDIVLERAERAAQVGFYLPSHSFLEEADIKFICSVIRRFYDKGAPELEPPRSLKWVTSERAKLLSLETAAPEET